MERHRPRTSADELAAFFADDAQIITLPTAAIPIGPSTRRAHPLKVTLSGTTPPIWRRIVVDGSETLSHLHDVIQAAFDWYDTHLHDFEIDGDRYAIPHHDDWTPVKDDRHTSIDQAIGNGHRNIEDHTTNRRIVPTGNINV